MTSVSGPRWAGPAPCLWFCLVLVLALAALAGTGCQTDSSLSNRRGDDDSGSDDTGDDTGGDDDTGIPPGAIVDTDGDVGKYSSLELIGGDGNTAHISYYGVGVGLKYAVEDLSGWQIDVVDDSSATVGLYTSQRLDSSHVAHIAYYDQANGHLKVADGNVAEGWDIADVDDGAGTGPDGSDADVGAYAFLDLNTTEDPMVAYYDATNQRLKFASRSSSAWPVEVVDDAAGVGTYCSMSHHRTEGTVYIAYYDATHGALKVATRTGVIWSIQTVDAGATGDAVGQWTSIRVDSMGDQHIAYYDVGNQNLKYAWFLLGGEDWAVSTLDSAGYVGANAELAIGTDSEPVIIYQDQDNVDVKLARRSGSGWTIKSLLTDGRFGFWMSLELDVDDAVVFSHYEPIQKYLLIYPPRE